MKKTLVAIAILTAATISINAVRVEKDPLSGKKFETQATEYKDGNPKAGSKPLKDEIEFKNGKLYSDICADDKMGGFNSYIKYDLEKDSTYMVEEEERHYYKIKASKENDDGMVINIEITIDDIDMEGSIKLSKNDKLKKHYEFVGKEVAKKKKK